MLKQNYICPQKYEPFGPKYLSFNVIKYHIGLESLMKLNKNAYKMTTLIFILFPCKVIHKITLNTFENKTIILEINNIKQLFVIPGFVKTHT